MNLQLWLDQLHRLIVPSAQQCLTCNNRASNFSPLQGVCSKCYALIPWIRKPRCLHCGRHMGCPDCVRTSPEKRYFRCNRSAVSYDAHMREWLAQYKYRGDERYAQVLTAMLFQKYKSLQKEIGVSMDLFAESGQSGGQVITAANNHKNILSSGRGRPAWKPDLITCIPVSQIRLQERGFNQAEVLGRGVAESAGVPFGQLLIRRRHTDKQSFKNRSSRLKDMSDAFYYSPSARSIMEYTLRNRTTVQCDNPLQIVIVDDIYTTGSTMNACAYNLRLLERDLSHPIELISLTWARS